ncbi:MAG: alpha-glucan family phosphorylase [Candidatus Bipolaricaulota bacterium]
MDITERFPNLPQRVKGLGELAFNLWWSWSSEARDLFRRLDLQLYRSTQHNPVHMLDMMPRQTLERAASSPEFLEHYATVMDSFRRGISGQARWFEHRFGPTSEPLVYMSAEFGVHVSLPVYAGGLGILAGDILKECSDLGVPAVGLGLIYGQAYVCQRIREDGWQEDIEQPLDLSHAPLVRVTDEQGHPLQVTVPGFQPPLRVEVWRAAVGRVHLYLLSTDVEGNGPQERDITQRLYINDLHQRLQQEIVLGIGGVRVLEALGITPGALHLNDGHPALAIVERLRAAVQEGKAFDHALDSVYKSTIFTTHTPVPAGTDVFPLSLVREYLDPYCREGGLDPDRVVSLGMNPEDPDAGFNMTVFALRMSRYCNAVSRKHAEVSQNMWDGVRSVQSAEHKIQPITNGVHIPTWVEPLRLQPLLYRYLGEAWKDKQEDPETWSNVDSIPDHELWRVHQERKAAMLTQIRARAREAWRSEETPAGGILGFGTLLDPYTLTLGFARRFTAYKRPDLILFDRDRLRRFLLDPTRPVQILFTGKAHPADDEGKRLLQRIFELAKEPACAGRIAFVENYDQHLAKYLVAGVDVWLNNPLPPLEASGTSGMKASVNGVPNLSILDGWWPEAYDGTNGWAIGRNSPQEDRTPADADSLYRLLEETIIPLYYERGEDRVPTRFVQVMKAAIRTVAPQFNARRMVKEYSEQFYAPALGQSADG